MSARHTILFTILIAILLPYYYYVDRPQVKTAAHKVEEESLLNLKGIDALTITHGNQKIRYERMSDGQHYKIVQPQGKFIPQDLMQAFNTLLINAKSVEVVSTDPNNLAEFGLDKPQGQIIIEAADKPKPISIFFGNENPTHTAIYAQIEGTPKVFLLGKNLDYYQRLMFEWVEGKQGKAA